MPCSAFGQNTQANSQTGKPSVVVHYERARMQSDVMTTTFSKKPGDITISNDTLYFPGPVEINMNRPRRQKRTNEREGEMVIAENVSISDGANPVSLTADKLRFNNETKRGTLSGNITTTHNGVVKVIGETAEIDLSNNEYKIVSIR